MASKKRSLFLYGMAAWVLLGVWIWSSPLAWADGKIGFMLQRAMRAASDPESLNSIPGVFYREGIPHVRLFLKLSDVPPDLQQTGVELRRQSGDIYTATAPVERLSQVAAMPQVQRMEAVQKGQPLLAFSVPDILADEVWTNRRYGNQGEGVVVGMVDTGIFYEHEAFLDGEGNNRTLYIWDNTDDTECDPDSIQDGTCGQTDEDGHGTAVMGVIAGSGSDECVGGVDTCEGRGVAPRANIVAVASPELWSDEVVEGVAYVFDKADQLNMPAVVNLSLGFFGGPRDGSSLLEQAISNQTGPGRIVVAAAGNEALMRGHAEASVVRGGGNEFVYAYVDPAGGRLSLAEIVGWYDAQQDDPSDIEAKVWAFNEEVTGWVAFGGEETVPSPDGTVTLSHTGETDTARGFYVEITNANTITWRIQIRGVGQGQDLVDIDLWINPMTFPRPDTGELPKFRFTTVHEDEWERTTLTSPCTADEVICVASYNTNCDPPGFCEVLGEGEQDISSFSSRGPRRDMAENDPRNEWPWISAPGQAILTAYIAGENDYAYWRGTSFSSPHVAGTVALMFGASLDDAWSYSVADIKDFLKNSARDDGNRDIWGWGKLNASGAVEELFSTLPPPPPPTPQGLGEGDDICFIATAAFGDIDTPQVRRLREMRDRSLMTTSVGRRFVRFYYRWSPPVAAWLKEHALSSRIVRLSLMPVVGWSEMAYHRSSVRGAALSVLGLFFMSAVSCFSYRRRTR